MHSYFLRLFVQNNERIDLLTRTVVTEYLCIYIFKTVILYIRILAVHERLGKIFLLNNRKW